MKIVFYGANATTFLPGLSDRLTISHEITSVPDAVDQIAQDALNAADVVVGVHFKSPVTARNAQLFQLPAAGYDQVVITECGYENLSTYPFDQYLMGE